mmetsp:Transcript_46851/g.118779  ORF Transcript_46851/g.118779 Transcript_46851/m.118779 type:complete len:249 (+) Transcript_46851:801-1547(+)
MPKCRWFLKHSAKTPRSLPRPSARYSSLSRSRAKRNPVSASMMADQRGWFTARNAIMKAAILGGARVTELHSARRGTKSPHLEPRCGTECQSAFNVFSFSSCWKNHWPQTLSLDISATGGFLCKSAKGPSGSFRKYSATAGEQDSSNATGARWLPNHLPNHRGLSGSRCLNCTVGFLLGTSLGFRESKRSMAASTSRISSSSSSSTVAPKAGSNKQRCWHLCKCCKCNCCSSRRSSRFSSCCCCCCCC